jgi:hypothetical protein
MVLEEVKIILVAYVSEFDVFFEYCAVSVAIV